MKKYESKFLYTIYWLFFISVLSLSLWSVCCLIINEMDVYITIHILTLPSVLLLNFLASVLFTVIVYGAYSLSPDEEKFKKANAKAKQLILSSVGLGIGIFTWKLRSIEIKAGSALSIFLIVVSISLVIDSALFIIKNKPKHVFFQY